MKREELKNIVDGITDEQLKQILDINTADIGKAKGDAEQIKEQNETLIKDKSDLELKIKNLTEQNNTAEGYKKELEELKKTIADKEAADKAAAEDKALTDSIVASFGDKKFTSDYVKNGIIADMKIEIAKPENKSKGYAELFENLTKDKEGIFANPNPAVDMANIGNVNSKEITDAEARAIMGLPSE